MPPRKQGHERRRCPLLGVRGGVRGGVGRLRLALQGARQFGHRQVIVGRSPSPGPACPAPGLFLDKPVFAQQRLPPSTGPLALTIADDALCRPPFPLARSAGASSSGTPSHR
ncbi:MAG: hypothetical protein ACK583_09470 [Cyanobacteriota bacterium]